jgi:hypothetical protein
LGIANELGFGAALARGLLPRARFRAEGLADGLVAMATHSSQGDRGKKTPAFAKARRLPLFDAFNGRTSTTKRMRSERVA